ncbi:MAG TPA: DUF4383 domain-containing protein [Solirubrobacterales bacterium]
MAGPSPARLYATLVGGVLVVAGLVGFFYSSSFGSPGNVDDALGALRVNGWHNLFHIGTGAIGLLVANRAARRYALWLGGAYVALAIWGFILAGEATILGFFPVNGGDDFLHLTLGALGVAAALATPVPGTRKRREKRRSRPKAKRESRRQRRATT